MKKYLAEFFATGIMVFCGTGAIVINQESGGAVTHLGIAITFGLIVMSMIYAFGSISGAHMNPAVTLALSLNKKFPVKEVPAYIISQLLGAIGASLMLHFIFPNNDKLGATLPAGSELQSFILEFLLTFFLMLVIIRVTSGSKETLALAGISIGMVVLLEALFAGPICGASMNPARSIAPALISGHLEHLWIYIVAPITGAIAAIGVGKIWDKAN
jgi:aquaporin NIP